MGISSTQIMAMAGGLSAASSLIQADTQAQQNKAEAAGQRDLAAQQSERVLRATARQRSAARAATAASGAKIDEFSLGVEQDIQQAGEMDAANVLLGGERTARAMEQSAKLARAQGLSNAGASLLEVSYKGWKNPKGKPDPAFARMTTGNKGSGD